MSEVVLVDLDGPVMTVTINRPTVRNALDRAVAVAIRDALDRLEADPALRVGILQGADGNFSAGMDLKAFLNGESPTLDTRGLCGLTQSPPSKPLIAAVEGWALAGGFELVLACDLVVAAESARFGLPEVKRGLFAAAGGALLLARRIPQAVALEMLLTGDVIDATRAVQLGLVNRLTESGGAHREAAELGHKIAQNGPLAVRTSKALCRSGGYLDWVDGWTEQDRAKEVVFASADATEGAAAFTQKRQPVWTEH